jgi:cysteine desulfurase
VAELAYLDHAATSPLRPEVAAAVAAVDAEALGNPSGAHRLARAARRRLDDAREEIADALGCRPGEVVLTSGGTEADNLAILGPVAAAAADAVAVCSAVEHHAVLDAVEAAGGTVVAVERTGAVDLDALDAVLDRLGDRGAVVSVMLANNETGALADLDAVAATIDGRAPLHTDAVAAARWLDLRATAASAAMVSVSAHKLGGPTGVGALVVRDGVALRARQVGGGQERDRRSGTASVAGAVGLATALRLAAAERAEAGERVAKQRDRLVAGLVGAVDGVVETLPPGTPRVPATAHVCVAGVDAEALLFVLDERGVCASAASSCASGAQQSSHVLAAMGVDPALGRGSLRLSLGPATTEAEVDLALAAFPAAVAQLRAGSAR